MEHNSSQRADSAGHGGVGTDPDTLSAESVAEPTDDGPAIDLSTLLREPQQERSRKTLARIVDAAHLLLAHTGSDALTVQAIAKKARTSVGSFYARFDGKDELVRYLGESALRSAAEDWSDRFHEALGEALADAADRGPLEGGEEGELLPHLRGLAAFLLEGFRSGDLARLEHLDGVQDPAPTRHARYLARVGDDLEDLFGQVAGAPPVRCRIGSRMLLASVRALALDDASAPRRALGPAAVAAEVARAVSLYVESPVPGRAAEEGGVEELSGPTPPTMGRQPAVSEEPAARKEPTAAGEPAAPQEPAEQLEPVAQPAQRREPAAPEEPSEKPGPAPTEERSEQPEPAAPEEPAERQEPAPAEQSEPTADPDSDEEPEDVDPFDVWG